MRQDVAMTGSLSVRGDVLPVGGVTFKIEAAAKAGIKTVLIPRTNINDVLIEEKYKSLVTIIPWIPSTRCSSSRSSPRTWTGSFRSQTDGGPVDIGVCRSPDHQQDTGMTETPGIRYYDLRQVSGQSTHIDVDMGVIESAGTTFYNKAVIRVLGPRGWGSSRSIITRPYPAKNSTNCWRQPKGLRLLPKIR